jgi:hypothetical protein
MWKRQSHQPPCSAALPHPSLRIVPRYELQTSVAARIIFLQKACCGGKIYLDGFAQGPPSVNA